jgi:hypothetical protein
MRLGTAIAVLVSVAGLFTAGCSCGGGGNDGIKNSTENEMSDANSIAKQVDGNYDKLTPDQKQIFIKMANGNEGQAKKLVQMMAHPPNEKYQKKS